MKNVLKILSVILIFAIVSCSEQTNKNSNSDTVKNTDTIKKDVKKDTTINKSEVKVEEVTSKNMLSIRKKFLWKDASKEMGAMYGAILKFIGENKLKQQGAPISLAHAWDDKGGDSECAIYVAEESKGNDKIKSSKSYAGKVAVITHTGPYSGSSASWGKLYKYIQENNLEKNGTPWEEYVTDPMVEKDENKYITKLYQPIK